jgi:hypothetical protein
MLVAGIASTLWQAHRARPPQQQKAKALFATSTPSQ